MDTFSTIAGVFALIVAVWLGLKGDYSGLLLILLVFVIAIRKFYLWPWPYSIESKYDNLVKEVTKKKEWSEKMKEGRGHHYPADSKIWEEIYLENLQLIHDLHLHLKERYRNQPLSKDIERDWARYIQIFEKTHDNSSALEVVYGEDSVPFRKTMHDNTIVLEEIEKRFKRLNK